MSLLLLFRPSEVVTGISGTVGLVTPLQTLAVSGVVAVSGSAALVTPKQTLALTGVVQVGGALALGSPLQTFGLSGSVAVSGAVGAETPQTSLSLSGMAPQPEPVQTVSAGPVILRAAGPSVRKGRVGLRHPAPSLSLRGGLGRTGTVSLTVRHRISMSGRVGVRGGVWPAVPFQRLSLQGSVPRLVNTLDFGEASLLIYDDLSVTVKINDAVFVER